MYNMGYITKNHAGRNISAASGLLVSAKRGEGCILVFDKPVKKCANCLVMCDKLINTHTHTHTHSHARILRNFIRIIKYLHFYLAPRPVPPVVRRWKAVYGPSCLLSKAKRCNFCGCRLYGVIRSLHAVGSFAISYAN